MKNYTNIQINPLPEREVEIIGTITAEKMSVMREKALAKLKQSVEIDGFRKGNAPDTLIVSKVGEMRILEEAAEIALGEEYPNILEEHKIDAIGRPEISVTKLGIGNAMEFKAKTALSPKIKLNDYKKVVRSQNLAFGKEMKPIEITEKEIDDTIKNIRENIAHQKLHNEAGGGKEHNHRELTDADLPEVNDEFAKMVGPFATVAEMRGKIKENIAKEKEMKEKDKKRVSILEAIMSGSTIQLPKVIIESEKERMLGQFKNDIESSGVSYADYLTHVKKTEGDLKKEWHDTAVKRAQSQFVLNTIAKEENIAPKEEDVKREVDLIVSHHQPLKASSGRMTKEADRFRVRMYVETFLTNELVFQFLEGLK